MKKIILTLASVLFIATTFAQSAETLKEGTVIAEITNGNSGSTPGSVVSSSMYLIQDKESGMIYRSLPITVQLSVGSPVGFVLNEFFETGDIPTEQKMRSDSRVVLKTYFETGDVPTEQ